MKPQPPVTKTGLRLGRLGAMARDWDWKRSGRLSTALLKSGLWYGDVSELHYPRAIFIEKRAGYIGDQGLQGARKSVPKLAAEDRLQALAPPGRSPRICARGVMRCHC